MESLFRKRIGFSPYNISDIKINSKNYVFGTIDYSYSSTADHSSSPSAFVFDGEKTASLYSGFSRGFQKVFIDHKDNIWCFGSISECAVLTGKQLKKINFINKYSRKCVWAMQEDAENRIWFGTEDGIYISDNNPLNR